MHVNISCSLQFNHKNVSGLYLTWRGSASAADNRHTALHNEENPLLCVKDYRIVLYFFGLFAPPQANITEMQAIPHRKAGLSETVWYTGITTQATSNLSRSSELFHFISNTNILKKFFLLLFQLAYFYTISIHMDLSLVNTYDHYNLS